MEKSESGQFRSRPVIRDADTCHVELRTSQFYLQALPTIALRALLATVLRNDGICCCCEIHAVVGPRRFCGPRRHHSDHAGSLLSDKARGHSVTSTVSMLGASVKAPRYYSQARKHPLRSVLCLFGPALYCGFDESCCRIRRSMKQELRIESQPKPFGLSGCRPRKGGY